MVIALAQATGRTGRYTLVERWRNAERLLPVRVFKFFFKKIVFGRATKNIARPFIRRGVYFVRKFCPGDIFCRFIRQNFLAK